MKGMPKYMKSMKKPEKLRLIRRLNCLHPTVLMLLPTVLYEFSRISTFRLST